MKWEESELKLLSVMYPTHTYAQIGLMLNRSSKAVKHKALSCGFKKRKTRSTGTWSDYEVRLLRELYEVPGLSVWKVAEKIGKTVKQVYNKAGSLGITKTNNNGKKQKSWKVKLSKRIG